MTDVSIVAMLLPIWMAHRKHLKSNQDFHVFEDIPKDLYELRKQQMKKCKEARERGCKAYFSKANLDTLFVNGKYVAPDQPLQ